MTAITLALGRDVTQRHPPRRDVERYMTASGEPVLWRRIDEAAILRAFATMGRGEGVRCG
ncbi:MAG TPA: hypothetical protein VFS91_01470 [Nitrobacter sp.]|nr:hypothetical protein [Nitrobacter sp.]